MELRRMNSGGSQAENLLRQEQLRRIFDRIDRNNDGQVSKPELKTALENAGIDIPDHVSTTLLERGDIDADGTISFEEFCKLVSEPDMMPFFQKFFNIPPISKIKDTAMNYWQAFKCCPPPIINLSVVIVQIVLYIIDQDTLKLKNKLEFQPSNRIQPWRYYTYSLIHMNLVHLLGNSFFQLLFGTALEPVHGYRVGCLYIIGVFSGSLMHFITNHASTLVGASAGASALILAWCSDVVLNWAEQSCPMVSLVPVILFVIWQFVMTPGMTSVPAHLSGGITGFLFGFIVLKNIKEYQFERNITKIAVVMGILYLGTLILMNICNVYT